MTVLAAGTAPPEFLAQIAALVVAASSGTAAHRADVGLPAGRGADRSHRPRGRARTRDHRRRSRSRRHPAAVHDRHRVLDLPADGDPAPGAAGRLAAGRRRGRPHDRGARAGRRRPQTRAVHRPAGVAVVDRDRPEAARRPGPDVLADRAGGPGAAHLPGPRGRRDDPAAADPRRWRRRRTSRPRASPSHGGSGHRRHAGGRPSRHAAGAGGGAARVLTRGVPAVGHRPCWCSPPWPWCSW